MLKIQELLQKEMTRQEFLATIGVGIISLFGLSSIMGILSKTTPATTQNGRIGYGRQNYGP